MKARGSIDVPEDLATALRAQPNLRVMLERLRPSCQRKRVASVVDAKHAEPRRRRVAGVVAATVEGSERHPRKEK
jgi:uncharacterized protein YdeI (YjbR/CyaY-like superfamily)